MGGREGQAEEDTFSAESTPGTRLGMGISKRIPDLRSVLAPSPLIPLPRWVRGTEVYLGMKGIV